MCFHSERSMNWFLSKTPQYSAVVMRHSDGRYLAGWLVTPTDLSDVAVCIESIKIWHPTKGAILDLTVLNQHRARLNLPPVDEKGIPVYGGKVAASAEDTPIGQEIKDLLAQFARGHYELEVA